MTPLDHEIARCRYLAEWSAACRWKGAARYWTALLGVLVEARRR